MSKIRNKSIELISWTKYAYKLTVGAILELCNLMWIRRLIHCKIWAVLTYVEGLDHTVWWVVLSGQIPLDASPVFPDEVLAISRRVRNINEVPVVPTAFSNVYLLLKFASGNPISSDSCHHGLLQQRRLWRGHPATHLDSRNIGCCRCCHNLLHGWLHLYHH